MGIVGSRTLYHAVMVALSLVYVVPLGWMVMSSFKTKREIFDAPFALPSDPDFGNWAKAWERGDLGGYILNSLFTTVTSVTIILIASLAAAYAFSRLRFRGSALLLAPFVLGLLLPVQSYLTAQARLFDAVYLLDTRWVLVVSYAGLGLSLAVFLFKGYLDSMPREIFEAARMDGAGDFRTLVQIVLPLMAPGISTVAVFSILSTWNEFLLALLYVTSDDLRTIPAGLLAFIGKYATDYPMLFAALSMITLPVIAVYTVFHKQIIAGVTEGSVQ
ncbi:MAG TPA: carbohydrate ABC transporter permease [Protaetiibacter sp.]|nr:carbohydrate ABC transporter permease [Protaetiibacter sp.]